MWLFEIQSLRPWRHKAFWLGFVVNKHYRLKLGGDGWSMSCHNWSTIIIIIIIIIIPSNFLNGWGKKRTKKASLRFIKTWRECQVTHMAAIYSFMCFCVLMTILKYIANCINKKQQYEVKNKIKCLTFN